MNQAVEDILLAKNGFVSSADVDTLGIPRATLARSASNGELLRISRGPYCTPDAWEDECLIASHRFGRGILSHETARTCRGSPKAPPSASP